MADEALVRVFDIFWCNWIACSYIDMETLSEKPPLKTNLLAYVDLANLEMNASKKNDTSKTLAWTFISLERLLIFACREFLLIFIQYHRHKFRHFVLYFQYLRIVEKVTDILVF